MALVRFGSLVQAASGALGSLTFSRHTGGAIARTRPIVKPHSSQPVLANQAVFSRARAAWQALSTADRLTWIRIAGQFPVTNRLGFSRPLSPFAIFMGSAMRNLLAGVAVSQIPNPLWAYLLGKTISIEVWPGGPATLTVLENTMYTMPGLIVAAQRPFRTHPGLPGQLWRVIARPTAATYAVNIWNDLIADLPPPARLEWLRFQVTQWVPAWPRTITSRHFVQIQNVGNELVTNGDFQIGGTPPAGWSVTGTGVLTRSAITPYADGYCANWVVAAAQPATYFSTAVANWFPLVGGANYTIRLAYRVTSGATSNLRLYGTGMSTIVLKDAFTLTTGDWITWQTTFTPDGSCPDGHLVLLNNINIAGNVDFDNISIRKDVY